MERPTAWQDRRVAEAFLDERRAAVPYGGDQLRMLLQLVRHLRPGPRTVADLGCGDGLLARVILDEYPEAQAVLLDHSSPMLERARDAMAPYGDRCRIVQADLAGPLARHVPAGTDLVVSGYAIHHLPSERKRALYAEIFALLAPGGLFVNLEHVASATPRGEALFDQLYIAHLAAHNGKPLQEVAEFYYGRPDRADNLLDLTEVQLGWLREIGFVEVDCYFKWLELAVFGGVKPDTAQGAGSSSIAKTTGRISPA